MGLCTMMTPPIAYSIREAVAAANIGRSSLYEAIAAGRLPARKLGKRTLILHEDLTTWLDGLPPVRPSKRA